MELSVKNLLGVGNAVNFLCNKAHNSTVFNLCRGVAKDIEQHCQFYTTKHAELMEMVREAGVKLPVSIENHSDILDACTKALPALPPEKLQEISSAVDVVKEALKTVIPSVATAALPALIVDKMMEKTPHPMDRMTIGEALNIASEVITVAPEK